MIQEGKEDLSVPLKIINHALDLDPNSSNAHVNKGMIKKNQGDLDEALQLF